MAKTKFDACLVLIDDNQQITVKSSRSNLLNSNAGFNELLQWFARHAPTDMTGIFCMEATGVYYEQLAWHLHLLGHKVSVVLPNKSRHYLRSLGLRSKTDKLDAKGLATMAAQQSLPAWTPISTQIYELRQLTRHYEQLQESRTVFRNQLHAFKHSRQQNEMVYRQLQESLRFVEQQIKEIAFAIEENLKKDDALWEKVQCISSIKGLGIISIATIIAETNGFLLFKNLSQLVCYAGYDIIENQSGNRRGRTRISKKGNSRIRRILFMPAFNVVKFGLLPFLQLYERVYARSTLKMKGYTAVQRKLLIVIYTLWKKNEPYKYNPAPLTQVSGDNGSVALFPSTNRAATRKTK
jgi:transposase